MRKYRLLLGVNRTGPLMTNWTEQAYYTNYAYLREAVSRLEEHYIVLDPLCICMGHRHCIYAGNKGYSQPHESGFPLQRKPRGSFHLR